MKTGDGETEDRGALTRNEENVIRLPRDWLGPPEELVPIGPAARARAAQRELDGGTPPTADAFWSEDSAALHDALQAPPPASRQHLDPPVGLVPPLAGRWIPTLSRLPRLRLGGRSVRVSRWWGLVAVPIVALVVAAVIGTSQSPASHPAAAHVSASRTPAAEHGRSAAQSDAARVASTSKAASVAAASGRGTQRATTRRDAPVRARARTRPRSTRPTKTRHAVAVHHSSGSPAATVTEAAASPPPTQASPPASPLPTSTGSTASAGSTASTPSASGARGSKPATGPAGPTSIGSVTGGCNPKCS